MKVRVDISSVITEQKRAMKELEKIPGAMTDAVRVGAAYERATHLYRNRTGNLNASTHENMQSATIRLSRVDLEMGYTPSADYASFVNNRRLSNIDPAALDVGRSLDQYFAGMAQRISGEP